VSEKAYHDGQWHSVVFSRLHTNGKLIIDNETVGEGSSKGATKSINIVSPYYIGGISPNISSDAKFNIKVRSFCILTLDSYTSLCNIIFAHVLCTLFL
jgi:laminin alpha 3/5